MTNFRTALIALVSLFVIAAVALPLGANVLAGGSKPISVRKDVKDLTKKEKREFIAAIKKAKRTPDPDHPGLSYYDVFVNWHNEAFLCANAWTQNGNYAGAAHNSPTFLPWHRQFLAEYEAMLRKVSGDEGLTLPYWDWTDEESTAATFSSDFMGGNGDPDQDYAVVDGPFRKGEWNIILFDDPVLLKDIQQPKPFIVRNFGSFLQNSIDLPSKGEVSAAITVHRYDHAPFDANSPIKKSFRNYLEGFRDAFAAECVGQFPALWEVVNQVDGSPHVLHNAVHIYTGGMWFEGDRPAFGTMLYNTSPNDPVFFLHHANVDRIFAAWEQEQGQHYRPKSGAEQGWNATDTMWPWKDRTINSWFGTVRNGYRYASLPQ